MTLCSITFSGETRYSGRQLPYSKSKLQQVSLSETGADR
jgi:hypothetical protein